MEKEQNKIMKVVRGAIYDGVANALKNGAGKAQVDLLITKVLIDETDLIEYVIKQEVLDVINSRHFKKTLRKHLEEDLPKTIADSVGEQAIDLSPDVAKEVGLVVQSITSVKDKDQRYK